MVLTVALWMACLAVILLFLLARMFAAHAQLQQLEETRQVREALVVAEGRRLCDQHRRNRSRNADDCQ